MSSQLGSTISQCVDPVSLLPDEVAPSSWLNRSQMTPPRYPPRERTPEQGSDARNCHSMVLESDVTDFDRGEDRAVENRVDAGDRIHLGHVVLHDLSDSAEGGPGEGRRGDQE
ncbi:hypothetical protein PG990_009161 [Apiospora arundinis]